MPLEGLAIEGACVVGRGVATATSVRAGSTAPVVVGGAVVGVAAASGNTPDCPANRMCF